MAVDMRNGSPAAQCAGFTYVFVLLMVAVVGFWLTAAASVWEVESQREKERDLLSIGHQFRNALDHYAASTVGQGRRFPLRLEDLLLDERTAAKRRHLRKLYRDPMTGKTDWGLIRAADGQIIGIHSLSTERVVKQGNFSVRDLAFTGKQNYSQWVFMATTARSALPAASTRGGRLPGR